MSSYGWSAKLREGAAGVEKVKAILTEQEYTVVDVTNDPKWQICDIDLLVNGEFVEVKTDQHEARNMAIELTVSGGPGCLFKSRARFWLYYFEREGKLYWLDLPRLQWYVTRAFYRGQVYQQWVTTSIRGDRAWTAGGVNIPIEELYREGVILSEVKT